MTTQEATHALAAAAEETTPLLEIAPPFVLDSEPTPFPESESILEIVPPPPPSPEGAPAPSTSFEPAARTPSVEYTPPTPAPRPAAASKPARKADKNNPDPFVVGVRLLRLAPAWLLFTTVVCGALVLALGWMRAGGDSSAIARAPRQNDARAVETAPKPAVANAPEVSAAASAPAAAPARNDAPAQKAPEPAPAEPPAPADDAGAKFTVQVGSYTNQSEANEHVSRLRAAGFESRAAAAELPGRGTWYRVQVGRFADRAEATKAAGQLRASGAAASSIVAPLQN